MVDKEAKPGMFWLTGSQKFHLMRNVSETLAGRVAILDLLGLSNAELDGRSAASRPFLPTRQWINAARSHVPKAHDDQTGLQTNLARLVSEDCNRS